MKIKKRFARHVVNYMSCISYTFAVKCFKKTFILNDDVAVKQT